MMSKLNQILAGVLILQIALIGYNFFLPREAAQAGGGPLLPDFDLDDVVGLTIEDDSDNRIVLAKEDGGWVLPEAGDFPANGDTIGPFLEKFEGVETNRLVTQTEGSHKRLGVAAEDFTRLVELELAGGETRRIYIGSSAGAGATHLRLDDQPEVYLTAELNAFDANALASAWIDTLYFTLPQTATTALTLENENGVFVFEKEGDTWTMEGLAEDETLNEAGVTALVNQAGSVQMTAPIGTEEEASFGLDEPLAVVTLQTEEGNASQSYTLTIGAQDEADNSYVMASSESPYYVHVAEFTGGNFVNKTREDFLEAPPAEEGEIEGVEEGVFEFGESE